MLQIDKLICICYFAETSLYPSLYWKTVQSTISCLKRTQDSFIMTTCVSFVLLPSICTEIKNWKKISKFFKLFFNRMDGLSRISSRGPFERQSSYWRSANTQSSAIRYWYCLWDHYRRTCWKKCAEIRKYCEASEIQQTFLLYEQKLCRLPIFSLSWLWDFHQVNIQLVTTFNYMQWTSWKHLSEERISNPGISASQAVLFWNWIHLWALAF